MLAGVIYSLVGQIDFLVIGYFHNSSSVGQYQVAYLVAGNLLIMLRAITPVFKPMVAEHKSDNMLLEDRYTLATRWITMLTLPVALTLVLAPDIYLSILFTDDYSLGATALVALAVGYLLNASFGPEGMMLEGLGLTRITLLNTIILVSVNSALDVLLVPRLGILGAGIATATALTVGGIAGVVEIYVLRSIHPYGIDLIKVWVASILPTISGWILLSIISRRFLIAIGLPILVVVTYLLGLRVVDGFTNDDIEVATQLDTRLGYPIFESLIS